MGSLQGVADTLFIPLQARIFASQEFPEYFYDAAALCLAQYGAQESIRKKSSEYAFMASAARYYITDAMTKAFIAKHEKCNIIYLGAGLETAYQRLNGARMPGVLFYQVDLPKVIEARSTLLQTGENETLFGGDMFELAWAKNIDTTLASLIIVCGVFQYFTEEKVVRFIKDLQAVFAQAELIFDATNETGLVYANKYVKKTGNAGALMHFYINDSALFAKKVGMHLLEERPFFTDARKMLGRKLRLYTRIAMRVVDKKKRAILVHLLIN